MTEEGALLIVDDDAAIRRQMRWALDDARAIHEAASREEAIAAVRRFEPDIVLLDLGLPPCEHEPAEGLKVLSDVIGLIPDAKVVVITGQDERAIAREAIRRGAYDFFSKPVDVDAVRIVVGRARRRIALERENARADRAGLRAEVPGLLTASPRMTAVCRQVARVADRDVAVLLSGESGTGKELLAQALHALSPRKAGPFVAINCAAIPETLIESELFGYERGAFTGAVKTTPGRIEQANGGTLFLDEVGELAPAMQAKLLRVLQDRHVDRLGGRKPVAVDVRVVAATNQDLRGRMAAAAFREDLFYRLNEIGIAAPPLRERDGDAVLLARHMVEAQCAELRVPMKRLGAAAQEAVAAYAWPGNVRELINRTKRAVLLCETDVLEPGDFDLPSAPGDDACFPTLRQVRRDSERGLIERAIARSGQNLTRAAKLLGVSRPTLYEMMRHHGLAASASADEPQSQPETLGE